MADVITRLRLETTEYDSKLRNSTQALRDMLSVINNAGGDFKSLSAGQKELAGSFGTVATGANNARDRLRELVTAYNDVAKQYNVLSRELQQSDVGQAIAGQMANLKQRIAEAKDELYNASEQMKDTGDSSSQLGGFLDKLAGKFGINVGQLTKFGGALAVGTAALKVTKDAFMSSEANVDSWGGTVMASQGLYEAFCISLNNNDFSGFLTHIGDIITASKNAYAALDQLNTKMAIINPERARLQAREKQLRSIIRRQGANSAAGRKAQAELLAMEPELKASYGEEANMNMAVAEELVRRRLTNGNINLSDKGFRYVMKALSNSKTWEQFKKGARGSKRTEYSYDLEDERGYAVPVDDRNVNQKILDLFGDDFLKQVSPYLTASYNAQGNVYTDNITNSRYLKSGTGGKNTISGTDIKVERELVGLIEIQEQKIKDLREAMRQATTEEGIANYREQIKAATEELDRLNGKVKEAPEYTTGLSGVSAESLAYWQKFQQGRLSGMQYGTEDWNKTYENIINTQALSNLINEGIKNGVTINKNTVESIWEQILGGDALPQEALAKLENSINKQLKELGLQGIHLNGDGSISTEKKEDQKKKETNKDAFGDTVKDAGKVVSSVSSIASGIEQLGIELPEGIQKGIGILQGVVTILTGISTLVTIITTIQGAKATPIIGWALAHGGIVHAAGGYKVPGNMMSGDRVPAMLNSGELVLNRAQQGNLASQLYGTSNLNNLNLTATISGEQIRLALNNSSRRRGRGEYVTSKTIR